MKHILIFLSAVFLALISAPEVCYAAQAANLAGDMVKGPSISTGADKTVIGFNKAKYKRILKRITGINKLFSGDEAKEDTNRRWAISLIVVFSIGILVNLLSGVLIVAFYATLLGGVTATTYIILLIPLILIVGCIVGIVGQAKRLKKSKVIDTREQRPPSKQLNN